MSIDWRVVVSRADSSARRRHLDGQHQRVRVLGGDFERISGTAIPLTARRAVAAVGVDGSLAAWAPVLEGLNGVTLRALLAQGPTIYIGGDFTSVGGQFRTGFAAVDAVSGVLSQPEMVVLGETSIYGLATDGARTFVSGVSFGAPLVGSVNPADSALTTFGPTSNVVPTSAAFVAGRLYAGLEYDPDAGTPTARATRWGRVTADDQGLAHILDDGTLEYYAAIPGNPPEAPTLVASSIDNTVFASWTPSPTGAAATSYTLFAGSARPGSRIWRFPCSGPSFTASAPTGLYYLTVMARNGTASPASNEVPVQLGCLAPPPAPARAFLKAGGRWPCAGAARFRPVMRSKRGSAGFGTSARFGRELASFTTPAPLGTYYVRVRAVNHGVSPASTGGDRARWPTSLPVPAGLVGGVSRSSDPGRDRRTPGRLPSRSRPHAGGSSPSFRPRPRSSSCRMRRAARSTCACGP
jgi:hypothetical protein